MEVFNDDALFERFAGAFIGRDAVQITALRAAAEHEDGAGVGEVAMHSVMFQFADNVRDGDLVLHFVVGFAFDEHVIVTRNNFIIALAPYFFPLYAVMVMATFWAGHWFWNWRHYLVWFHLLLGVAYAFHVTLTWHILKHSQTDISEQGYLFSAAIIFLGNVAVLLIGIPLLAANVPVLTALEWWVDGTWGVVRGILRMAGVSV